MKVFSICSLVLVASCSSCAGGGAVADDAPPGDATGGSDAPPLEGDPGGYVTYLLEGSVQRLEAKRGVEPVDVSAALDALGSGEDESPAVSKNGAWMTLTTTRFSPCADFSCLARVAGDLSSGESVIVGGEPLRPDGRAAISNDGSLLVYPEGEGGPHQIDLFAVRRSGGSWGSPELLTDGSPHAYNELPVLSGDGERVLFDCGPVPYGQNGTGVCEVEADGGGFRRIVDPADNPAGGGGDFLAHHADYAPDGSVVFEADWTGEQIWVLRPGSSAPARIDGQFSNDNSPCVLPGGYVASLWLGRPGGSGVHELKVMAPDGSESAILAPDEDVADVGMSCHGMD